MSNISNRHSINKFVSGKSEALAGQRLAKVGYKSTKQTPARFASVCASVPPLETSAIMASMDALIPHIRTYLEGVQDSVIRSLYESSGGQLQSVSDDEISVGACINFLIAQGASGRLTSELIENWFDTTLKDNFTVILADKLGFTDLTEDNMATITKHLNGYRGLFAKLSGTKDTPTRAQLDGLARAMEVCSVDDETGERIAAKIRELQGKPVNDIELVL